MMNYLRTFAVIFLNLAIFAACAAKGPVEVGMELYQDGKYAEAIEYISQAIQNPEHEDELYLLYFHRAEAYKASEDPQKAFRDYYAAKILSCYLTKHSQNTGGYAKGLIPANYCNQWADNRMALVSSDIPEKDQKTIKQDVEKLLDKYRIPEK